MRPTPEASEAPPAAQAATSPDVQAFSAAQGMVRVHVDAGEHPFAVYFGRGARPIADCAGPCEFWAWPAKYRIRIQHGDAPGHDTTIALRVRNSGRYVFVPAHGKMQNLGLILGVSGPVIGVVGLIFTAVGTLRLCREPPPGESCDTPASVYVGLSALAAGGVMTAIGWPLYNHNRAHFQVSEAPTAASTTRVGLVALPRAGVGFGVVFAF